MRRLPRIKPVVVVIGCIAVVAVVAIVLNRKKIRCWNETRQTKNAIMQRSHDREGSTEDAPAFDAESISEQYRELCYQVLGIKQ